MKKLVVWLFAATFVAGGMSALPGGTASASAATCPTSYVDPTACANPTSGTSASVGVSAGANAQVQPAVLATTCRVAVTRNRRTAVFSVTAPGATVTGGTLLIKLHKVGTPGSQKKKMTISPYTRPITKRLSPGVWHGTMVYKPEVGSKFSYCGAVFRNLRIAKKKHAKHRSSVKFPTSVSAGLRPEAP